MNEIIFQGGPFDGFRQKSPQKKDSLPRSVIWLVCDDAFRVINGLKKRGRSSLTSVAVYELREFAKGQSYGFVGAISRKDFASMLNSKQQDLPHTS